MNLIDDNFVTKLSKVEELLHDSIHNRPPSPVTSRYYQIVQKVLNTLDEEIASEFRVRATFDLSKNARRRSNNRLHKLQSRKQRCLDLL
jgi:ferritin-like protein